MAIRWPSHSPTSRLVEVNLGDVRQVVLPRTVATVGPCALARKVVQSPNRCPVRLIIGPYG